MNIFFEKNTCHRTSMDKEKTDILNFLHIYISWFNDINMGRTFSFGVNF